MKWHRPDLRGTRFYNSHRNITEISELKKHESRCPEEKGSLIFTFPICLPQFSLRVVVRAIRGVSKSFRTGRLKRELQMVQLSATRCSYVAILWVSLMISAAITLFVASQREFIVVSVNVFIDSVRKLLDTTSYVSIFNVESLCQRRQIRSDRRQQRLAELRLILGTVYGWNLWVNKIRGLELKHMCNSVATVVTLNKIDISTLEMFLII
jgi:hypothetical protein